MRAWIYDGSFEGLLCTLSRLFESGERPASISCRGDELPLFGATATIATDAEQAERFFNRIREQLSPRIAQLVARVGMADRAQVDMALFEFLELAFSRGPEIVSYHAHPVVRVITDLAASVGAEIHRLKGLLRFRETQDGWLWGPMAPEHNICIPVAHHFRKRLPSERWMVHDVARQIAVIWEGGDWTLKEHVSSEAIFLSDREREMHDLWRTFFRQIAIAERRNPRRQAQHMPRRYWPYLIETPVGGVRL